MSKKDKRIKELMEINDNLNETTIRQDEQIRGLEKENEYLKFTLDKTHRDYDSLYKRYIDSLKSRNYLVYFPNHTFTC